jgi:hypothetical protein
MLPYSLRSSSKSPTNAGGPSTSFWSTRDDGPSPRPMTQQFTGSTTIVRQNTGRGNVPELTGDPAAIISQLTGGGLNPTRQLGLQGLAKQHTGGNTGVRAQLTGGGVRAQLTGNGGIRAQYTGNSTGGVRSHVTGGSSAALRSQLTGGAVPRTPIARPKSAGGIRSAKSFDEGRGMFLVRQLTGGQSSMFGDYISDL